MDSTGDDEERQRWSARDAAPSGGPLPAVAAAVESPLDTVADEAVAACYAQQVPPDTGIAFGRFRLLERIGAGGMAVVYRALAEGPHGFSQQCAIKRILPGFSDQLDFVGMLAVEARVSALLHHPIIVQVREFGQVGGEYFLAMEWVDGVDLHAFTRGVLNQQLRIPVGVACYIVVELASALAYAHALTDDSGRSLEIVHRDISPSNVMVTSQGGVKLLDFGIAKAAAHLRGENTRSGVLKGKISYMSPEQGDGKSVDRRSDIFSLGVVFHELLAQRRLFKGSSELETLKLVMEGPIDRPSHLNPAIPPELDEVVMRMLERSAERRYQSGDEVAAALRPFVHELQADASALKRFLERVGPIVRRTSAAATPTAASTLGINGAGRSHTSPLSAGSGVAGSLSDWKWSSQLSSASQVAPPVASRRRRAWRWAAAALLVAVVALVALRLRAAMVGRAHAVVAQRQTASAAVVRATPASTGAPSDVAAAPSDIAAAAPSAVAAAAATVALRVVKPAGGEVFIDGSLVGTVPVNLELAKHDGTRRLVVRHAGYVPWERTVSASVDVEVAPTLQRGHAARPEWETTAIQDPYK